MVNNLSVLMVLQIPIELRAPSAAGGNDRVFTATVGYDSGGCRGVSLRVADLARPERQGVRVLVDFCSVGLMMFLCACGVCTWAIACKAVLYSPKKHRG